MIYNQNRVLFSHKEEQNPIIHKEIYGDKDIILNKISQIQKEKCLFSHTSESQKWKRKGPKIRRGSTRTEKVAEEMEKEQDIVDLINVLRRNV
jgi:hypothetical protein